MIRFTVFGHPEPQGSKIARLVRRKGGEIMTNFRGDPIVAMAEGNDKKLKPWRQQLSVTALEASRGEIITKPTAVRLAVCFHLEKPASIPKRRILPTVKPDSDKLVRAVLDALTGTVFEDDAQVTDIVVGKRYGVPERAEIQIEVIEETVFKPAIAKELPLFAGV